MPESENPYAWPTHHGDNPYVRNSEPDAQTAHFRNPYASVHTVNRHVSSPAHAAHDTNPHAPVHTVHRHVSSPGHAVHDSGPCVQGEWYRLTTHTHGRRPDNV